MTNEKYQASANSIGKCLEQKFSTVIAKYEKVIDVRGAGLLWGLEMDSTETAKEVVKRMADAKVLLGLVADRNTVLFAPPMSFDISNARNFINVFENVLVDMHGKSVEKRRLTQTEDGDENPVPVKSIKLN